MIKRLLFMAAAILVLSTLSYSQWTLTPFGKELDTFKCNTGAHGVLIAPDGKIWVDAYRSMAPQDSLFVPDSGKKYPVSPIYVYNPDGTPASFSPIKSVTLNGKLIPFYAMALSGVSQKFNTGIAKDEKGNVIISNHVNLIKIDYKTGAGIAKWDNPKSYGITRAAVDKNGNVFVAATLGNYPIVVLNPDLTYQGNAVDTLKDIGRTLEVSEDGNTIFAPRHSTNRIYVFHRGSEFESYIGSEEFIGFATEALAWNPVNKLLYLSAGSYGAKPSNDPATAFYPKATPGTYYGVDVSQKPYQIKDSLAWSFVGTDKTLELNRGITFSSDGKTAIICVYNTSSVPVVQRYVNPKITDVKRENNQIVESYSLLQNYPNPFNPSTEIKFSVAKAGFVSLKVYDMLGKEVATLVSENMNAGSYTATFNASNLTSGIYVYQLSANGVTLNHKMTLLK